MMTSCLSTQANHRLDVTKVASDSSAKAQTLCPVMEGRIINKNLFVDYQGFRIYVCCIPCVKAVGKDPEKYLRKLREQGIAVERVKETAVTDDNPD